MLINFFSAFLESSLMFLFGLVVILVFSFLLRISFSGKIFKFFFASIIITSAVNFLSITNPEQNHIFILIIVSLFYLFLFFILKYLKKDSNKIFKMNFQIIFLIFLIGVVVIGKGEYLEKASTHIDSEISLGKSGEIYYKSLGLMKSDVGFFNEYGETVYDTIKYDINLDGFVDIKIIDTNDDGKIDDVIVMTYKLQKFLIIIYLLLSIILSYLFSNGKRRKYFKIKEKTNKKEIDLKGLKESGIKKTGNTKNYNNRKKTISLILLISLFFPFSNTYNLSYAEDEEFLLGTGEMMYLESIIKKECAKYPFDDSKCVYVKHFTRMYLQSSTKTKNSMDLFNQALEKEFECYSLPNGCRGENTKEMWDLQRKWKIDFSTEYNNKYPFDRNKTIGGDSILNSKYVWLKWNIKSVGYEEQSRYLSKFKNNNDIKKIEDRQISFGGESSGTNDDAEKNDTKNIEIETEIENNNNVDKKIVEEVNNNNNNNNNGKDNENKPTENVVNHIDNNKTDGNTNLTEVEIKKYVDEFSSDGKAVTDIANAGLGGVNFIFSGEIQNVKGDFTKKKDDIKKVIGNGGGKNGSKGGGGIIDKLEDMGDKIEDINKKNPGSKKKIIDGVSGNVGPISKAIDVIGKIGDVFDVYNDYKDFSEKTGGDIKKTTIATLATGGLKKIIGANPIDFVLSGVSGVFNLLGYDEYAKTVESYSLGNRAKELVEDGILHETDETIDTMDQVLDNFLEVMNDEKAGVIDKGSAAAVSTITFMYGTLVFGSNQIFNGVIGGIDSFIGGVDEIQKSVQ